jgi:hypothetical protein
MIIFYFGHAQNIRYHTDTRDDCEETTFLLAHASALVFAPSTLPVAMLARAHGASLRLLGHRRVPSLRSGDFEYTVIKALSATSCKWVIVNGTKDAKEYPTEESD